MGRLLVIWTGEYHGITYVFVVVNVYKKA